MSRLPKTREQIMERTNRVLKELGVDSRNNTLNIGLFHLIYSKWLQMPVDQVRGLLPSPMNLWYHMIEDKESAGCISLPMVYIFNPEAPVSCALLLCIDNPREKLLQAVEIVQHGIGVGIEMLYSGPLLIEYLFECDRLLCQTPGKRDNFIAVNILACHPDALDLIHLSNKNAGVFFEKIHIALWWSREFYAGNKMVYSVDRGTDLSMLKRNPSMIVQEARGKYPMSAIFQSKIGGGVPYLLHIEACKDYNKIIYGSNLCTEIILPLAKYRGDQLESTCSQLCVLCNVDVSKIVEKDFEARRRVYKTSVDVVTKVWDTIAAMDLSRIGLHDVDVESRPCGIGVTGMFSAACILGQDYNYEFASKWMDEWMSESNKFFDEKPKPSKFRFSIPPSSNSEFNMLTSPNLLPWKNDTLLIISEKNNLRLRNERHRPSMMKYEDYIRLSNKLDQSFSLDVVFDSIDDLQGIVRYMINGGVLVDGQLVTAKTISYYTRKNVIRTCIACDA